MWHHPSFAVPPPLWRYTLHPPAAGEYVYFEGSAANANFSLLQWAGWMADASMLAYGRYQANLIDRLEFAEILERAGFAHHALIGNWGTGSRGTQAYFAYNPNYAVLSFRGTEPDDWMDLASDGLVWPVSLSTEIRITEPAKTLFHLTLANPLLHPQSVGVHAGFQHALNEVWGEIEQWLTAYSRRFPNASIYFTGHSLGAALATLAFARWNSGRAQLFTYGSPRVGNAAFCGPLNQCAAAGKVHRFVNGTDLVTHIPTTSLWYAHSDGCSPIVNGVLGSGGSSAEMPLAELVAVLGDVAAVVRSGGARENEVAPDALRDHSPARYCQFLWKAAGA